MPATMPTPNNAPHVDLLFLDFLNQQYEENSGINIAIALDIPRPVTELRSDIEM